MHNTRSPSRALPPSGELPPAFFACPNPNCEAFKPNDQIHYLLRNLWSTSIPSALGSIIFFGDEFSIPAHDSIWRKQHRTLLQHISAEPPGFGRNPHSLAVVQQNPVILLFLMLQKDSHLFSQVIDRFVQLLVDAISQTCDQ